MIDTANPNNFDLSSLKTLGTVGEPISPEAWHWVHQNIGRECCPIVDTWWQTESGGILISSFPGATPTKPGAVSLPLFGIKLAVLDPKTGHELKGNNAEGVLTIAEPWPGQMITLHNHRDQFETTYFNGVDPNFRYKFLNTFFASVLFNSPERLGKFVGTTPKQYPNRTRIKFVYYRDGVEY
jgi:acyl-coenzyme A synthetase/AMP-(fatty) acid ligase